MSPRVWSTPARTCGLTAVRNPVTPPTRTACPTPRTAETGSQTARMTRISHFLSGSACQRPGETGPTLPRLHPRAHRGAQPGYPDLTDMHADHGNHENHVKMDMFDMEIMFSERFSMSSTRHNGFRPTRIAPPAVPRRATRAPRPGRT